MTKWEVCLKHLTPPAEVLVVSYLFPGTAFLLERTTDKLQFLTLECL